MTPGGDWVFAQDDSPLCACGHQKSDHGRRFKLGQHPERLVCDAVDDVMLRTEEVRRRRCKCKWFRLALGQEEAPPPRARTTDPETSHEAAARVAPHVAQLDNQVHASLSEVPGGMTTRELADRSGIERVSVSPRMKPMEIAGRVERTSERRDGGIVWRAL
jgi:hypothetical protein